MNPDKLRLLKKLHGRTICWEDDINWEVINALKEIHGFSSVSAANEAIAMYEEMDILLIDKDGKRLSKERLYELSRNQSK